MFMCVCACLSIHVYVGVHVYVHAHMRVHQEVRDQLRVSSSTTLHLSFSQGLTDAEVHQIQLQRLDWGSFCFSASSSLGL